MNIILNGAKGKMGSSIKRTLEKDNFNVYEVDIIKADGVYELKSIDVRVDGIIDFSTPDGAMKALDFAFSKGVPLVCGTTGLSDEFFEKMKNYSSKIAIFYSPNMSVGINLCFFIVDIVSKKLDWDMHIHEVHHKFKKDMPSGTALYFKKIIESNNKKASVTSSRIGDIAGEHEITFALNGEKITISHIAYNREIFANGAVMALKWIISKPAGIYSFKDIMGF